jgi:uncharacterized membrane protein required for colicin V production
MVLDLICLIVLGYGFWIGYSRGIIKTIFTVLSVIIGVIAAFKFSPGVTDILKTMFNNSNPLMFIAGLLLTFVATMLLIRLFARGLEGILRSVNINILNQMAGGILLGAVMVLLYSSVLWFADSSRIITDNTKRESMTYPYLEKYPAMVWNATGKLRPIFVDFWEYTVTFMDQLQRSGFERSEPEPTYYNVEDDYDADYYRQ